MFSLISGRYYNLYIFADIVLLKLISVSISFQVPYICSRIIAIMKYLCVPVIIGILACLVAIWLMGRSPVKQENVNIETCLHLNQHQVLVPRFFFSSR